MIRLQFIAMTILGMFAAAARADQDTGPMGDPIVVGLVKVAEERKLPAKEAGVLARMAVQEGSQVAAGQPIAQIDDSEPQVKKKAAAAAYKGAYNRWQDDIEVRFAQAQAEVAKAKYDLMRASNVIADKTVTQVELNEAKLDWDHFVLAIEKAGHDKELAKYEAFTKQAELDAADLAIRQRVVTAPFAGVVEEIKRHQDEWVQPGDTILTLLKMDTMHVEGAVEQSKYDPYEVQGCDVTVDVELARGHKATFNGRIIRVSSIVRSNGVYNVRAEIVNKQEHGDWLLRDGLPATMRIHLGTGGPNARVSRAQ